MGDCLTGVEGFLGVGDLAVVVVGVRICVMRCESVGCAAPDELDERVTIVVVVG